MFHQFNGMTANKINEEKKHKKDSLRNNILEKNHKAASLRELRKMFEGMGINEQDKKQDYRRHDYMFHKFRPEKDDIQKFLSNLPEPSREPKKDLNPIPMGDGTMFTQHRIDKINAFKIEALEANIIKGGKPRTTGSHRY